MSNDRSTYFMKKIIVFGASGDTGRHFVEYFIENYGTKEYEIIACGTRKNNEFDKFSIKYYSIDNTDKDSFDVLPKDVYAVVNLAGLMPARMKGYFPQRYIDVNITGNLNILEFCRENKVDRMIFAQSFGDIKDWGEEKIVLTPDMPRNFKYNTDHTVYVMAKNFTVDLMRHYREMYGLKTFVFRLPTIYLWSPVDTYYVDGEVRKIGYRILIDKAINGEPIEVWGDPSRVKDMVYIKDFCQMMCKALFVDKEFGHYNVGSGVGTSLDDQIKGIVEVFGEKDKKSVITYRPDKPNAPQYIMDISNARDELSYEPQFDYISALEDMKREMLKEKHIC